MDRGVGNAQPLYRTLKCATQQKPNHNTNAGITKILLLVLLKSGVGGQQSTPFAVNLMSGI
jgi:hypothetical protein